MIILHRTPYNRGYRFLKFDNLGIFEIVSILCLSKRYTSRNKIALKLVSEGSMVYPQSISIFFPMYNERANIEQVIARAEQTIPELGVKNYEILIIDDGSRDGSAEIVQEWSERNPQVCLVRHPRNMGYGAALRTGFATSRFDAVFYTDCDLPVDLGELVKNMPLLKDADLVIGYRKKRFETLRRAIFSRTYNVLMRLLFNVHVRDVNFSFKLVRKQVLDRITLTAGTVFIDGQLLAESVRYGYSILEVEF